ncbi:hypothetical protein M5K25_019651 [Dendrobium thyrsiflorum]|uniref:Transcription initiation factor TFIID component TAF4 C-terminal domain-containing protein n=1 Tax=Dendrobium thyrsiflorum TaxID=117978 RepID=A0ABD0UMP4_DENTH
MDSKICGPIPAENSEWWTGLPGNLDNRLGKGSWEFWAWLEKGRRGAATNPVQSQSQSLSLICGTSIKFPPKEPPIGKKKTLEPSRNSPPQARKKQKTSGAFLDQSIEQLNDVTAVSGVNLRAEEEQLLVARTEGTQASEAIQRVVQEEEETSILQKGPLQKKLTQIISRCGLGGISKDVEHCLSMCVEERLRSFIGNVIRLSKQRVDIENKRHKLVVTSDIQHQILTMNQKAKKEWEKEQAEESEKFWKLDNEVRVEQFCGRTGRSSARRVLRDCSTFAEIQFLVSGNGKEKVVTEYISSTSMLYVSFISVCKDKLKALADAESDVEQDKDNRPSKKHKFHREEDDKMRTTAANAAARSAIGVDDMLSKWQLMAEQARQKRESKLGVSSIDEKYSLNFRENLGNLEEDGGMSRHGRSLGILSNPKIDRAICIKDVIAALEKEPMMSRSTLLYRLYERRSGGYGAG